MVRQGFCPHRRLMLGWGGCQGSTASPTLHMPPWWSGAQNVAALPHRFRFACDAPPPWKTAYPLIASVPDG